MAAYQDTFLQRRFLIFGEHHESFLHLDRVLSFLTSNAILVSCTTTGILFVSSLLLNSLNVWLLLACFFLTLTTYNLNRLTDLDEDLINAPEKANYAKKHQTGILLTVLGSGGAALLFASFCDLFAVCVILIAIGLGCLYSVRIFGFRLKDVFVVKNVTIAGTSVICAAFLPLAVHFSINMAISLVAYFVFIKVLINTILFDVRDVEGDRLAGAETVPVLLGKQRTKGLLLGLNATLVPWVALSILQGFFYRYIAVLAASVVYGFWYIVRLCRDEGTTRKSVDLLVDGEWILIAVVVIAIFLGPAVWSSFLVL
jgi:4-hydroxybenzoate polyprenyltransferase